MKKSMLDILWIVVASGLVFFMQAGFALVESGMTRSKNSINVAIKNLTDLGVSVFFFWIAGFALMFGPSISGWFGIKYFAISSIESTWVAAFFTFQVMFCSTSATIVSGAVAERMKYISYIISTILMSMIIYPVFGHWVWGGALTGEVTGFLGKLGFIDFAGSTVVHSTGGWVALAVLILIGPRIGRFSASGQPNKFNGSNIPMVVLGVLILWFGWFGFNGGSTLAMNADVASIILRTTLAGAAALVVTLAVGWIFLKVPDVGLVTNGALAGLVAITASVPYVTEGESVLIGAIGGIAMLGTERLLLRLKIDDAVGAIPVHLAAGIWGTLAVALFGNKELLKTGLSFIDQLGVQALGIVLCGVWGFGIAFLFLFLLNKILPLRVTHEEELSGLNVAEHGATTEILDLYNTMEEQTKSGDLSKRANIEPFTEVGQIATVYNKLLDSLESNLIEKSEYYKILNNVHDGFFLINPDHKLSDYHSLALVKILGTEHPGGKTIDQVLLSKLSEESKQLSKDYITLLFDKKISDRQIEKVNPLTKVKCYIDDKTGVITEKILAIRFQRILKNNAIVSVMGIVQDITQETLLELKIEKNKRDSEEEIVMLQQILPIPAPFFNAYLKSTESELNTIGSSLKNLENNPLAQCLSQIYRSVHTIKGDSQTLGIAFLADNAHLFEEIISEKIKREKLTGEDFIGLTIHYAEMESFFQKLGNIFNKLKSFQSPTTNDFFIESLQGAVERVSKECSKKVHFEHKSFNSAHIPALQMKELREALLHIVRNSVYHGIETPEVRIQKGKEEVGKIELTSVKRGGKLILTLTDNGKGVDTKAVLQKMGISLSDSLPMADAKKKAIEAIFTPGFSTAQKVDLHAGRGIGLDIVKSNIEKIGGKISIDFDPGFFTTFTIEVPVK